MKNMKVTIIGDFNNPVLQQNLAKLAAEKTIKNLTPHAVKQLILKANNNYQ
jgi:hypothetical protein